MCDSVVSPGRSLEPSFACHTIYRICVCVSSHREVGTHVPPPHPISLERVVEGQEEILILGPLSVARTTDCRTLTVWSVGGDGQ